MCFCIIHDSILISRGVANESRLRLYYFRTPIIGEPNAGNHYGPARSFLGSTSSHDNGMADLLTDENGVPLVYDPRDVLEGGNMVLWDDARVRNYEITY